LQILLPSDILKLKDFSDVDILKSRVLFQIAHQLLQEHQLVRATRSPRVVILLIEINTVFELLLLRGLVHWHEVFGSIVKLFGDLIIPGTLLLPPFKPALSASLRLLVSPSPASLRRPRPVPIHSLVNHRDLLLHLSPLPDDHHHVLVLLSPSLLVNDLRLIIFNCSILLIML
jgi:hypothetical protein